MKSGEWFVLWTAERHAVERAWHRFPYMRPDERMAAALRSVPRKAYRING
jgi:hypothetical protein